MKDVVVQLQLVYRTWASPCSTLQGIFDHRSDNYKNQSASVKKASSKLKNLGQEKVEFDYPILRLDNSIILLELKLALELIQFQSGAGLGQRNNQNEKRHQRGIF